MSVRVVRLGSPREPGEGVRLGTVRRPPRGVRKEDFARLDYFDLWLPELAPSEPLRAWIMSEPITPKRWQGYARRYRREMSSGTPRRTIELLAVLSHTSDFSVGCYCEDASHCHRSLLAAELREAGASIAEEA